MYRMVVRRILQKAYRQLSHGDYEAVLKSFDADAVFCFAGTHALGGELHGIAAIRGWFEQIFRYFPDLRLAPQAILVNGPPWNTLVATRFLVSATLPDGGPYANEGMQFMRLRWGRVIEDRLYEDTQALGQAMDVVMSGAAACAPAPPATSVEVPHALT